MEFEILQLLPVTGVSAAPVLFLEMVFLPVDFP